MQTEPQGKGLDTGRSRATISPSITVSSGSSLRSSAIPTYLRLKSLSLRERRWTLPRVQKNFVTSTPFLADFLSRTVLVGFLTGVGFQVGIAVLGEMFRLEVHAQKTVEQLTEIIRSLPRVHLPSPGPSAAVVGGVLGNLDPE